MNQSFIRQKKRLRTYLQYGLNCCKHCFSHCISVNIPYINIIIYAKKLVRAEKISNPEWLFGIKLLNIWDIIWVNGYPGKRLMVHVSQVMC